MTSYLDILVFPGPNVSGSGKARIRREAERLDGWVVWSVEKNRIRPEGRAVAYVTTLKPSEPGEIARRAGFMDVRRLDSDEAGA